MIDTQKKKNIEYLMDEKESFNQDHARELQSPTIEVNNHENQDNVED